MLLDRILGEEDPKVPVHEFMAALAEYKRGAITKSQIVTVFELSGPEATSLQAWLDSLDGDMINRGLIHDVLLLGEGGYYNKTQVQHRLGV